MGDKKRGVYEKFRIERTDGKSAPGQKHHGCRYFVLDLDHDKFAIPALAAYAKACKEEYPLLAADVRAMARASHPGAVLHEKIRADFEKRSRQASDPPGQK